MGIKLESRNSPGKNFPGPGQYDTHSLDNPNMKSGQKFSVGTGKRVDIGSGKNAKFPGPGNYESSLVNKT